MERKLTFGKYKGQTIKYIILTHIGYIMWCIENISWFNLNQEEQNLYDAIAILIKKTNIEASFPKEPLYAHVKDRSKLEKLETPFVFHNGYVSCFEYNIDNPIIQSIISYITNKTSIKPLDMSALNHSWNKDNYIAETVDYDNEYQDNCDALYHDMFG